jgi:hypothetical protein
VIADIAADPPRLDGLAFVEGPGPDILTRLAEAIGLRGALGSAGPSSTSCSWPA